MDTSTSPDSTLSGSTVPARSLWHDGLGRAAARSAQVLLILTLAAVSVFGLLQIRMVVLPVLIALILAAAIGPVVNLMRRRGVTDLLATWTAFLGVLVLFGGTITLLVLAVRSEWDELVEKATAGLDEFQKFITSGPFPIDQQQIDEARQGLIDFATSQQVRSGAVTGISLVTELITGMLLMAVILFFFLKDGGRIWNFPRLV